MKAIISLIITTFFVVTFSPLSSANSSLPNNRHIAVTGSAQVQAKPDIAMISMSVESTQKESLAAKQQVDFRVNQFLDGASKFNITEQDISASSIATQPKYTYVNNQQVLTGYKASRSLKVSLKDITKLNQFLDFALSAEINQINNIELKSSQELQLKAEATALAVKDAKSSGSELAQSFDAKLGRIYSINASSSTNYGRYGANKSVENITFSQREADTTRPGKYLQENLIFTSSVSVVFDLELN